VSPSPRASSLHHVEGDPRPLHGLPVLEQAQVEVHHHHDAFELVGDLAGVGVLRQVAFGHGELHRLDQRVDQVLL
jgi:hypothetical protein